MIFIYLILVTTFATTWALVAFRRFHGSYTCDDTNSGVQKVHATDTPRVGGVSLFVGLSLSFAGTVFAHQSTTYIVESMIWCSLPLFLAGLAEDITKNISPLTRLVAANVSALLAGVWLNAWLISVEVDPLDVWMSSSRLLVIAVTCFAVSGLSHAFNILDGFNGLTAGAGLIILGGFALVAQNSGDNAVSFSCLAMMAAIFGFLCFNYPLGKIFLGDGGAYLIGFWISVLAVLITNRDPSLSKWFPVVVCSGILSEMAITIIRRIFISRTPLGAPDNRHMHQLIFNAILKFRCGQSPVLDRTWQTNAKVAPFVWAYTLLATGVGIKFSTDAYSLKVSALALFLLYVVTYISLSVYVRRRAP